VAPYARWRAEERRRELRFRLAQMEFLARLLGSEWRAPELDEGGGCDDAQKAVCREEFGEFLEDACSKCPRRLS